MLQSKTGMLGIVGGMLLVSGAVNAQGVGYVGAAGGQSKVDVSGYEKPSSYKVFYGVAFASSGALELAYNNLGRFKVSGMSDTYLDVSGLELTALGRLPLMDRLSLFARAGFYSWNADATLFGTKIGSDSGTDFTFGAGVSIGITDTVHIQLEYQKYNNVTDGNIDTTYAGLSFSF